MTIGFFFRFPFGAPDAFEARLSEKGVLNRRPVRALPFGGMKILAAPLCACTRSAEESPARRVA